MSEFEEELNKIVVEVETPIEKYIVEKATSDESLYAQHYEAVLEKFKDWHSPEHIEKEVQAKREKLPVVPNYVDEFINGDEKEMSKADRISYLLKSVQGDSYYLTEELPRDETITFEEGSNLYNWSICQHHETILKLWGGYTVEEKRFYLKNKITGRVLVYDDSPELSEVSELFATGGEFELENYTFTQEEIDSMQTGSYERIEVEE